MRHEIQSLGGRKARQSSWRLICRRRGLLKCIHRIRQLVLGFMLWQRFFCFVGWRPCSVWRICLVILNALLQLCQWWRSWKFPVLFVCLFSSYSFPCIQTPECYCEHGAVRTSWVNARYCLTLISWGSVAVSLFSSLCYSSLTLYSQETSLSSTLIRCCALFESKWDFTTCV